MVCVCAGVVLPPGTRTVAGPEAAPAPSSDQAHGEENTPGDERQPLNVFYLCSLQLSQNSGRATVYREHLIWWGCNICVWKGVVTKMMLNWYIHIHYVK